MIFLMSSERSGSNMLRAIMARHSQITAPTSPHLSGPLVGSQATRSAGLGRRFSFCIDQRSMGPSGTAAAFARFVQPSLLAALERETFDAWSAGGDATLACNAETIGAAITAALSLVAIAKGAVAVLAATAARLCKSTWHAQADTLVAQVTQSDARKPVSAASAVAAGIQTGVVANAIDQLVWHAGGWRGDAEIAEVHVQAVAAHVECDVVAVAKVWGRLVAAFE